MTVAELADLLDRWMTEHEQNPSKFKGGVCHVLARRLLDEGLVGRG